MPADAASAPPTTRRRRRTHPVWRGILAGFVTLLAAVVLVAEARIIGDAIEQRDLAAFYAFPTEGIEGEPGTIVRSEELVGVPFDARAWRVMYRTTDLNGKTVLSTGVVEFHPVAIADHGTIAYLALPGLLAWLDAHRL